MLKNLLILILFLALSYSFYQNIKISSYAKWISKSYKKKDKKIKKLKRINKINKINNALQAQEKEKEYLTKSYIFEPLKLKNNIDIKKNEANVTTSKDFDEYDFSFLKQKKKPPEEAKDSWNFSPYVSDEFKFKQRNDGFENLRNIKNIKDLNDFLKNDVGIKFRYETTF